MKKIIVFTKSGRLRFVGHLDVMRAFQRALNRAGVKLAYSQGFNPHPLMSFASPLSLGYSAKREIVEIVLSEEMSDEELLERLMKELPEGLKPVSCRTGIGSKGNAMSLFAAAGFELSSAHPAFTEQNVRAFMEQEQIPVEKLGKVGGHKRRVTVDIKPLIYDWQFEDSLLKLRGAGGAEVNFNPEHWISAFLAFVGEESAIPMAVCRTQLFWRREAELLPLEDCEVL